MKIHQQIIAAVAVAWLGLAASPAFATTRLKDICRVKGQESNTLHGLGIVVGLPGTGDGGTFLPTIRSLATAMDLMKNPIGKSGAAELKESRNVALVTVTATIPPGGARQGDELDCVVSSIGAAKSLAGGELFLTAMQGPQVDSERVFAFAQGQLHVDDPKMATRAKVHRGCRLEEDFINVFAKDNKITLVLDEHHADFEVAQEVADVINSQLSIQSNDGPLARAQTAVNVEVRVPAQYQSEPVAFISQVLALTIQEPQTEARVVVNEKTGSIVIGADVTMGAVVVTHKNVVVETGDNLPANRFVPIDTERGQTTKLKALVEALNALKVPQPDVIDIIKSLERNGKLHGKLIVE
ncbi:MAG: flagellar basal body P-ring protein FlgI [Planctomycetes bacterium]|nr:flagellar basal body P-ring protein FlgI [Planctomycetota bacterium]